MSRNYERPNRLDVPAGWADSRETHNAVAAAIHAIASGDRTPQAIWESPTQAEMDHVHMAVEEYIREGDYPAEDDGLYQWGAEAIKVSAPQGD